MNRLPFYKDIFYAIESDFIFPHNTKYLIYKNIHFKKYDEVCLHGLKISSIGYLDYISLYLSGMITLVNLDIKIIIIDDESQLHNLPGKILGLDLKTIVAKPETMDLLNEKYPDLEFLDLSNSSIKKFNYEHRSLKKLIICNSSIESINTDSMIEYVDISFTNLTPEYFQKYPFIKTIRTHGLHDNPSCIEKLYIHNNGNLKTYSMTYDIIKNNNANIKPFINKLCSITSSNMVHTLEDVKKFKKNFINGSSIYNFIKGVNRSIKGVNNFVKNFSIQNNIKEIHNFIKSSSIQSIIKDIHNLIKEGCNLIKGCNDFKCLEIRNGRIKENIHNLLIEELYIYDHDDILPTDLIYGIETLKRITLVKCIIPDDFFFNKNIKKNLPNNSLSNILFNLRNVVFNHSLEEVTLIDCLFQSEKSFRGLGYITKLVLSNNINMEKHLFYGMRYLTSLTMKLYSNKELYNGCFEKLYFLELTLDENIEEVNVQMLYSMFKLEELILSSCSLGKKPIVHKYAFQDLINLKKITLCMLNIKETEIPGKLIHVKFQSCIYEDILIDNLMRCDTLLCIEDCHYGNKNMIFKRPII